jgi:hypothetical protein
MVSDLEQEKKCTEAQRSEGKNRFFGNLWQPTHGCRYVIAGKIAVRRFDLDILSRDKVRDALNPDESHFGSKPFGKSSVFSDATSEKSDFVAANPDKVGPTGRTTHTSECDLFGLTAQELSALLVAGMSTSMHLLQTANGYLGVNLSCLEAGMPKDFLQTTNIRAIIQHARRHRVAEGMT